MDPQKNGLLFLAGFAEKKLAQESPLQLALENKNEKYILDLISAFTASRQQNAITENDLKSFPWLVTFLIKHIHVLQDKNQQDLMIHIIKLATQEDQALLNQKLIDVRPSFFSKNLFMLMAVERFPDHALKLELGLLLLDCMTEQQLQIQDSFGRTVLIQILNGGMPQNDKLSLVKAFITKCPNVLYIQTIGQRGRAGHLPFDYVNGQIHGHPKNQQLMNLLSQAMEKYQIPTNNAPPKKKVKTSR